MYFLQETRHGRIMIPEYIEQFQPSESLVSAFKRAQQPSGFKRLMTFVSMPKHTFDHSAQQLSAAVEQGVLDIFPPLRGTALEAALSDTRCHQLVSAVARNLSSDQPGVSASVALQLVGELRRTLQRGTILRLNNGGLTFRHNTWRAYALPLD